MLKKFLTLFIVVLAGETIFMHPFLVPRLYRSLMMEVWGVNNLDIGIAFSSYGVTAMISYVLGGPFADKFAPRSLMVISLLATALGSSVLLFSPSSVTLSVAYGFFGVSTILLMWSAMIKVTHEIGGQKDRSFAMGILEGGRGFIAAAMASFLVLIVSWQTNAEGEIIQHAKALNSIYLVISLFMLFVCLIVWFGLKNVETIKSKTHTWTFAKALAVAKNSKLWPLAVIIFCAYCSYKNIGNYSVYMRDVKGMSIAESSTFTSYIFWGRPIAALLGGVIADKIAVRFHGGRFITLMVLFIMAALGQFLLMWNVLDAISVLMTVVFVGACFAFALRSLYFSVFGDFKIEESILGTAIGLVSLVGYFPDFFYGALTGHLIDRYPGELGFTYVFTLNGFLLLLGAIASYISYRKL